MSKALIVICDGTMQSLSSGNALVAIARSIVPSEKQLVYYDPGVATLGTKWRKLFDGATGRGLMKNLKEAYCFLSSNYVKGDKIFLLGYSRGAATIRLLVDLMSRVGLLYPHQSNLIPQLFEAYIDNDEDMLEALADMTTEEAPPVEQVICFDTCFGNDTETANYVHLLSEYWKNSVKNLYHFMAAAETRAFLQPFRWLRRYDTVTDGYREYFLQVDHSKIVFLETLKMYSLRLLIKAGVEIVKEDKPIGPYYHEKPWYSWLLPKNVRNLAYEGESLARLDNILN